MSPKSIFLLPIKTCCANSSRRISTTGQCFEEALKSIWEMPGPRPVVPYYGTSWIYKWFGPYPKKAGRLIASEDFIHKYGPIYREYFGKIPLVSVYSPRDIRIVMRNQGMIPIRPSNESYVAIRRKNIEINKTVGLTESNGEEWKRLRSKVVPIFLQKPMNEFYEPCSPIADEFVQLISKQGGVVDDSVKTFNLPLVEMSWMMFFGDRLGAMTSNPAEDINKLIQMCRYIVFGMSETADLLSIWKKLPNKHFRRMERAENHMRSVVLRALERKRDFNQNDLPFTPIAVHFLKMDDLDFEEVATLQTDFLVPSALSLGSLFLTLLLHRLGREPRVLKNLQKEIDQFLPNPPDKITFRTFRQMPYLKAVLKEAYRLTTIIPSQARLLPTDIEIRGYHIPAYTPILCQTRAAARTEEYFTRALEFLPERWLAQNELKDPTEEDVRLIDEARSSSALVKPFGVGARLCAGKICIEIQMMVLLSKLLKSYSVKSRGEIEVGYYFVCAPTHSVPLEFIKR